MGGLGKHISHSDREYFEIHGKWYPDEEIKCPWCGRKVELKNDRIKPHIQSTKVKCVGSGQKPHPLHIK